MASLLLYGQAPELLSTRSRILRSAGHEISCARDIDEVHRLLREVRPQVLIICHTVEVEIRDQLLDQLEIKLPTLKVLTLTTRHRPEPHPLHTSLDISSGPATLVKVVEKLVEAE